MTGTIWLEESGILLGPVMLTNTLSVGVVREAVVLWMIEQYKIPFALPLVTETYDGYLNDIRGSHVRQEHALSALTSADSGVLAEGNVGGGTGMICHGFKGGIGTASRRLGQNDGGYTVGVMVQANHGKRRNLLVGGIPMGTHFADLMPHGGDVEDQLKSSSIIVVVATDCPLLPHQLRRVAQRASLGIGRVGGMGENYSGDIFLAFSTASLGEAREQGIRSVEMYPNERMDTLFEATAWATEEAIIYSMVAAETMTGIDGNTVYALPHDRIQEVLSKYNRLALA
jgi:L-aminopeptidase/D-esterase-like protein